MNENPPTLPPSAPGAPWGGRPESAYADRPPTSASTAPPWPPAPLPSPDASTGSAPVPRGPSKAGRRSRRATAGVALVGVALTAGLAGGRLAANNDPAPATAVSATRASLQVSGDSLNVAAVLAATRSSVVSIETTVTGNGPWATQGKGAGTGIVLDTAGHILTNAHVVEGATSVRVTLARDKSSREATIVASDATADVAVLKVTDTSGLVAANFDRSKTALVGDDVVAIGNALALQGGLTVTQGIVSALDRSIDTENGSLTGLIQTDAAISSGNSGGPLVNAQGEVIGMNAAVATSSAGVSASNIGFAISTDTALKVAERLLAGS